jgi:phosphomannomutase
LTLIKSISGIRGTIGGKPGDNLSPEDIVKFSAAFGQWVLKRGISKSVVIGRDARLSGDMLSRLVSGTLMGVGLDVIDLGLSTTPTVEMAVTWEKAGGGIILTASHNPGEWNALKLLNEKGEFISGKDGQEVLAIAEDPERRYAEVNELGTYTSREGTLEKHIEAILELDAVDVDAISKANFSVVVDAVNSSGGIAVPALLDKLGVKQVHKLYCEPNGRFPHNPEPLAKHLTDLSETIRKEGADLGISVDPDVDRLVFANEDGNLFGEEYTLVAIADYISDIKPGSAVSNLSSTRALRDVMESKGLKYFASAVGEVNVVEKMKAENAVIGGEGNGGVILPDLHYGRDALVGIALFLSHLAKKAMKMSELKSSYPAYFMAKEKISLKAGMDVDGLLEAIADKYRDESIDKQDGVKIDFADSWVHLRKSNTEPIIRVYTESGSQESANALADKLVREALEIAGLA